ncbi:unnamed protein product, partial [Adineta ricciae]
KSSNPRSCETLSTIDVISLFQPNTLCQQSFTVSSTLVSPLPISSKPQAPRQLLKSLIPTVDNNMPLAQNYKDDVSLLESEAAFTNVTMGHANVGLGTRQGTNSKPNQANDRSSTVTMATTVSSNDNLLADDDLPEIVPTVRPMVAFGCFALSTYAWNRI